MFSRIGISLAATAAVSLIGAPAASATLKAPAPQSPASGAHVETVPAFTWGGVRNAAQYEFQAAADPRFGSIVSKGSFRTRNTAATLQDSLADGTYFWRVRAIGASDKAGRWSRTRSFEKSWTTSPQLVEPADALSIRWPTLPLVMRWSAVPHATKYYVTVATDPSLANPVIGTPTKPVETRDRLRPSGRHRRRYLLLGRHAGGRGQLQGPPLTRGLVHLELAVGIERAGARSRPGR